MTQNLTILFDLDGTIVNTAPDLMAAHNHVMRKFGFEEKKMKDIKSLAGKGAWVMMQRSFKEEIKDEKKNEAEQRRRRTDFTAHRHDLAEQGQGRARHVESIAVARCEDDRVVADLARPGEDGAIDIMRPAPARPGRHRARLRRDARAELNDQLVCDRHGVLIAIEDGARRAIVGHADDDCRAGGDGVVNAPCRNRAERDQRIGFFGGAVPHRHRTALLQKGAGER